MFTTILFLLVLTVLVFVHELGHFLLAKKVGARVDEFAIGFPPRLFSFKRGETVYAFNLIPFGGYVKIFGEDGDSEGEDTSRSLAKKPRHLQILVLAAGIIFNTIFAWLLLSAAFMIGLPSSVDNYFNAPVSNPRVTVLSVSPNSPAAKAGITANVVIDEVIADGTLVSPLNVKNIQDAITQTKKEVVIIYSSATSSIAKKASGSNEFAFENTVTIKPTKDLVPDRNTIGISMDEIGTVKLPFIKAILAGAQSTWYLGVNTVEGLASFFGRLFTGSSVLSEVSGPVGIAKMVGEANAFGFAYLLSFTALISINLAIMNALPIPALDGGRIFIVAIEAIIRRPLNAKAVNIAHLIGFVLLIALMVAVTWNDIMRLF